MPSAAVWVTSSSFRTVNIAPSSLSPAVVVTVSELSQSLSFITDWIKSSCDTRTLPPSSQSSKLFSSCRNLSLPCLVTVHLIVKRIIHKLPPVSLLHSTLLYLTFQLSTTRCLSHSWESHSLKRWRKVEEKRILYPIAPPFSLCFHITLCVCVSVPIHSLIGSPTRSDILLPWLLQVILYQCHFGRVPTSVDPLPGVVEMDRRNGSHHDHQTKG